jgi:hypothetical protein
MPHLDCELTGYPQLSAKARQQCCFIFCEAVIAYFGDEHLALQALKAHNDAVWALFRTPPAPLSPGQIKARAEWSAAHDLAAGVALDGLLPGLGEFQVLQAP